MSRVAREPAAFGSLYYTDCLPGQGLSGGAGFQFQARSADLGETAQRTVARACLYEVPSRWLRERRPVEDYPRSLAHVVEDDVVTAAGRYLGKEAKGHREGNQFTHALVTRDVTSYGLLRPAQLWGAPWWAEEPAPTTVCPPVPALPEPGPWDTETVRDHVRADRAGRARLLALVSAFAGLHGPDRRRVLFVADDGAEVACWIAAASLLLDRDRALRVSFKIFCSDPDRSPHDVLAVHPDWADAAEHSADYVVVDLRGDAVPPIPVTDEAAYWVPLFLDGDALDVVDAVELAGQLARETSTGVPGPVERTAAALALGAETDVERGRARAVARWLADVGPDVVDLLGVPLAETLAASTDLETLDALDAATARRAARPDAADLGWPDVARGVRRRLVEHEVQAARQGQGVAVVARLAPVVGTPELPRDLEILVALSGAEPTAAMTLADRYALTPTDPMVTSFVRWWADHPGADVGAPSWDAAERVRNALVAELERRLEDPDRAVRTREDVHRHWWRRPWELWRDIPVLGRTGPRLGLHLIDVELAHAAYSAGGAARSDALLRVADIARATSPADEGLVSAWYLVLGRAPVPTRDVRRFVEAVPPEGRTARLATVAYYSLTRAEGYDDDAQQAVDLLEKAGHSAESVGVPDYPPSDPAVAEVVDELRAGVRPSQTDRLWRRLSDVSRPTRADRARLLEAVLDAPPLVSGPLLLGRSKLRRLTMERVEDRARGGGHPPEPKALALAVVHALLSEKAVEKRVGRVLRRFRPALGDLGERGRAEAFRHLLRERDDSPHLDVVRLWALWQQGEGFERPGQPAPPPRRPEPDRRPAPPPAAPAAEPRRARFSLRKKG